MPNTSSSETGDDRPGSMRRRRFLEYLLAAPTLVAAAQVPKLGNSAGLDPVAAADSGTSSTGVT
jgi:hypothetical protein